LTESDKDWALNFMSFMKEYLTEGLILPHERISNTEIKSMIHSTACGTHAVSTSDNFWKMKTIHGVSQSEALRLFLNQFNGIEVG
jgi:hypothetical protein